MNTITSLLAVFFVFVIAKVWIKFIPPGIVLLRLIIALICIILVFRYFNWRISDTLPMILSPVHFVFIYGFLFLELARFLAISINLSVLVKHHKRKPDLDGFLPNKTTSSQPLVDILIPTYNESSEILERSLCGALSIKYDNKRIWLLDDGNRHDIEQLSHILGVRYIARQENTGAKAGNLNNALDHIRKAKQQPDFIAVFDADFIAQDNFLIRTLPIFNDKNIGMVQTPQYFYNDGPLQYNFLAQREWPDEQRFSFDVSLPSRDAWGTTYCCGTSWISRFQALESIDGIPTQSVTEDYLTSLCLAEAGWRTAYVDERLSAGQAPAGIQEYIAQRFRWCLGCMQIIRGDWGIFSTRNFTFIHRFHLFEHFCGWCIMPLFRVVQFIPPIIFWFSGIFYLQTSFVEFCLYYFPMMLMITFFYCWISRGRILPLASDVSHLLMAFDVSKAALLGLVSSKDFKFKVTQKNTQREKTVIHTRLFCQFITPAILTLAGMLIAFIPELGPILNPELVKIVVILSIWNIVILSVTAMACIEKPRNRLDERISINEQTKVFINTMEYPVNIKNLSQTGALIDKLIDPKELVTLHIDKVGDVQCNTVDQRKNGTAIVFKLDKKQRIALIQKIYSNHRISMPEHYQFFPIIHLIFSRLSGLTTMALSKFICK